MSAMWFAARARVHRSDGRAYPSSPQMFLVSERGLHSRAHVYVQNVFGRRAADGGLTLDASRRHPSSQSLGEDWKKGKSAGVFDEDRMALGGHPKTGQ